MNQSIGRHIAREMKNGNMSVLMFGWEFPPHISGGLGTACYGLSKSLLEENVQLLFVVPKAYGDESIKLINASDVEMTNAPSAESGSEMRARTLSGDFLKLEILSPLSPYSHGEQRMGVHDITQWNYEFESRTKEIKSGRGKRYLFTGTYGQTLLDEVKKYSEVASYIGNQYSFDVIHAHDWLTYQAGIEAKKVSGKPLVVHVHATEYDRVEESKIDSRVYEIEKRGMTEADKIIAVSQWTKDILVSKYGMDAAKIEVVHNGVIPEEQNEVPTLPKIGKQVITFLGRITWQKGPEYFVEAAKKVLRQFPQAHFIMAGSGDLLPKMIEMVARLGLSNRFHFTGFLNGKQVNQVWNVSDIYVMPSVSEPFGITPLEAAQAGVPVIVSKQSGVSEVMDHAIKVDFWDTDALADAIIGILTHKSLSSSLKSNNEQVLSSNSWKKAAKQINTLYHELKHQATTVC